MFNRRRFLIAGGCAGLNGCAVLGPPGAGLPALPVAPPGPYALGAGDEIRLVIYDQPQLTGNYNVDDSGMVDLPLLGLVPAAGRSADGLSQAIAAALVQKQLILHPSVAVEIAQYRPFYILGEVTTPGQYPYRPGMTVLTAISIAGGFTYRAVQDYVEVTRENGSTPAQYRAPIDAVAQPGDVITVFERRF